MKRAKRLPNSDKSYVGLSRLVALWGVKWGQSYVYVLKGWFQDDQTSIWVSVVDCVTEKQCMLTDLLQKHNPSSNYVFNSFYGLVSDSTIQRDVQLDSKIAIHYLPEEKEKQSKNYLALFVNRFEDSGQKCTAVVKQYELSIPAECKRREVLAVYDWMKFIFVNTELTGITWVPTLLMNYFKVGVV